MDHYKIILITRIPYFVAGFKADEIVIVVAFE